MGSLIGCGLNLGRLKKELLKLDISGYKIALREVARDGLVGVGLNVVYKEGGIHKHTNFKTITKLIDSSRLSSAVKRTALSVFTNLADAESAAHGVPRDKVHFHEVGAVDSIIDIVGAAVALEMLKIEEIYYSRVRLGCGRINVRGISYPNPAPATAYLIKGMKVDFSDIPYELVTPTGAAILKALSRQVMESPPMEILEVGYGAGTHRIPNHPNMLRAFLGEVHDTGLCDVVTIIETNIDDMDPRGYEYLIERCFRAGALDIYLTPVIMKKSRPGCVVTVITPVGKADAISRLVFDETTTFGMRRYQATRERLARKIVEVNTKYGNIKVKIGLLGNKIKVITPEYEDCKKVSIAKNISFRRINEEAVSVAAEKFKS